MIQKKIGFMQGRLSEIVNNKIQCFPWENWENEFVEASKINLNFVKIYFSYNLTNFTKIYEPFHGHR